MRPDPASNRPRIGILPDVKRPVPMAIARRERIRLNTELVKISKAMKWIAREKAKVDRRRDYRIADARRMPGAATPRFATEGMSGRRLSGSSDVLPFEARCAPFALQGRNWREVHRVSREPAY